MKLLHCILAACHQAFALIALVCAAKPVRCLRRCRPAVEWLEVRTVPTGQAGWTALGPAPQHDPNNVILNNEDTSGRVTALAFELYNGQRALLVGTAGGGLWRSTDYKSANPHWTPLTDFLGFPPDSATGKGAGASDVGSIAVSGSSVFLGTGEANYARPTTRYGTGIFKSMNGGAAWSGPVSGPAGNPLGFFGLSISKIVVDPVTGNLYAAVVPVDGFTSTLPIPPGPPPPTPNPDLRLGVYQSTDGGSTWTKISGGTTILPEGAVVTDLEWTRGPDNKFRLFAGVGNIIGDPINGVYVGTSGATGFTWTQLPSPVGGLPTGSKDGRIALASDHVSTVYAAIGNPISGQSPNPPLLGVYSTNNDGSQQNNVSPFPLPSDPNTYYNLALGLSPSGRLYLGLSSHVLESNVAVTAWKTVSPASAGVTPHVDQHAFAFDLDGTVYDGNDGGVWRYNPLPFDPPALDSVTDPTAIAVGDFNQDGKQDVVVVNGGNNNTATVLLGDGTGGFPGSVTLQTGGRTAIAVGVGDLNHDGIPDIVVANSASNDVSVFINKGGVGANWQGFNAAVRYAIGFSPSALAVGDVNRDTASDLVLTDPLLDDVAVFLNNGMGGFPNQPALYTVHTTPEAVALNNFNADMGTDLVTANQGSGDVSVLLGKNDGSGTFPNPAANYAVDVQPVAVAAADFNGDLAPDVVTANNGANDVSVLLNKNDGSGALNPTAINSPTDTQPRSIAVGDFNVDGKLDVVTADGGPNNDLSVLLNKGDGSGRFNAPVNYVLPSSPFAVVVADLNGDGRPDIIATLPGLNAVAVLLNNGKITGSGTGTWQDLNSGGSNTTGFLNTTQVVGVALHPKNKGTLLEGSQDNGVALTTNAGAPGLGTWNTVLGGDGAEVRYDSTGNHAYAMTQNGHIFRSDNGGAFAAKFVNTPAAFPFRSRFMIDPLNDSRLIIGSNGTVFETRNMGDDGWPALSPTGDASGLTALSYAPSNDSTIYVGYADGQVFRTDNDGTTWKPLASPWGGVPVSSIVVDPNNASQVYLSIAASGVPQVWQDATGGAGGWTAINANLPDVPVNVLLLDTTHANTLFLGNDVNVYQGKLAAAPAPAWTWTVYDPSLPAVQVLDLQEQTYGTTTLLAAATHGRGVWWIDPPGGAGRGPARAMATRPMRSG